MKSLSEKMKRRREARVLTTIEIRLPEDIVEDLKEMAPMLGVGSYQALIRAYISMGMREDESRLNQPEGRELIESLTRERVGDDVIFERVAETLQKTA